MDPMVKLVFETLVGTLVQDSFPSTVFFGWCGLHPRSRIHNPLTLCVFFERVSKWWFQRHFVSTA